jgi:hypothetical protein
MNRAQRRAAGRKQSAQPDSLADALANVHAEAGGLLRLHVVRPADAAELLFAVLAGDVEAARTMRAVSESVAMIESAPRGAPMLCGCCPRPLRGSGFAVCVAVPHRDDPSRSVGFGLCELCADEEDGAALHQKAVEALRRVWPDGRLIQMQGHAEGSA